MVRNIIVALLIVTLCSMGVAQEFKMGVVASEVVMQNFSKFQQAEQQLGREVQSWQAERKGWEADMRRIQEEILAKQNRLQSGANILSDSKKQLMALEIDSLSTDFQMRMSKQSQMEQERFNMRRAELLAEVFEEVNAVIEEMGEAEGYDLIIDASNGSVVYAKDPDDLNDQLLQRLKERE